MQEATCCECGLKASIRSFYDFKGKTYCEPCVWKASSAARERGEPAEYTALVDNTACVRCGADTGISDTRDSGKKPFCLACASLVKDWPYPNWLKLALAGLLLLLGFALVHGRTYFEAGRDLYKGEKLVEQRHYAEAVPLLQKAVDIGHQSDKAVLLLAKAALLSGNIEVAQKALQGHAAGHFEDPDESFHEVDQLWNRAAQAMDDVDKASKLIQEDGRAAEAAALMHHAAETYPELPVLADAAEYYDEGAAFERKDYDGFRSIAEKQWRRRTSPDTAGALASALACKYAVTGDQSFRQQAEEMLDKARQLAQGDSTAEQHFQEYAERIRYRLETRNIIGIQEYNRRFRPAQAPAK